MRQFKSAESKLEEMKDVRGDHDKFANLTTEFLERAQSGFESTKDNWGGHGSTKSKDPLVQWVFDIVDDDRHGSQPKVSHADVAAPRSPREFPENAKVLLKSREGDHAYFFPQDTEQEPIPDSYRKTQVTKICQCILSKLNEEIIAESDGMDIRPNDPLSNQDQRDDKPQ